jgi:hypothetical protein
MVPIVDHAGLSAERFAELQEALADHQTLERAIRWCLARGHVVADVIAQDEYTQDVVVPLGDDLFLVYDAT